MGITRHRPVLAVEHIAETPPAQLVDWDFRCALVMPIHDLWVCVPRERLWRYPWLATAKMVDGNSPFASYGFDAHEKEGSVQPADRHAGAQRRGQPPPALHQALQEISE